MTSQLEYIMDMMQDCKTSQEMSNCLVWINELATLKQLTKEEMIFLSGYVEGMKYELKPNTKQIG